jgi:hypothetical protein
MRCFLVTVSVRDSEYEYWRYVPVPVRARTEKVAMRRAMKPDLEWTKDDYREVACEGIQEIPAADYEVLARYL